MCGAPLEYYTESRRLTCEICKKEKKANAACLNGHFVCDSCHIEGSAKIISFLQNSSEKDPTSLLIEIMNMPEVHMHGPEHHAIVACVLLTAAKNCGADFKLAPALYEAWQRGSEVPGGTCGMYGVCGAAAGAGAFASVLLESTPLNEEQWSFPIELASKCLHKIAQIGGPRCCKRTSRLSIETAAEMMSEKLGIEIPTSRPSCTFYKKNNECILAKCPYFPKKK
ncbi:MAG: hypothetical protein GX684_05945 [Ruminococcaceae bacterium]|nr:hypothetical protein [Oscillospiraceae bacterium]